MEGIESSSKEIRDLVQVRRELLEMEVSSFVQCVRDDPRVLDALGLYRAYAVADEWAKSNQRPREYELRALHGLVMATHPTAGSYKSAPNEIGGSVHVPVAPWDAPRAMTEMAHWFEVGSGDTVLDAAVVHAWLTHIHPFDDGKFDIQCHADGRRPAEISLAPGTAKPITLRWEYECDHFRVDEAADAVVRAICH